MGKLLYANGCSWTYGNGLPTEPGFISTGDDFMDLEKAAEHTWPAQLAGLMGYPSVVNDSLGGASNKRILRTTVDFIKSLPREAYKDLFVAIGWTTTERDEIYIPDEITPDWFYFNAAQKFSSQYPRDLEPEVLAVLDKYQETYIRHIYDERTNLMYMFQQKYLLSNLLENLGIKYVFFDSINAVEEEHRGYYTHEMDMIATPSMVRYMYFDLFVHENKLPTSQCMHPLSEGHRRWAGYLYTHIKGVYGDAI
jgi:hypothetical protein